MQLLALYEAIAASLWMRATDEGLLSFEIDGDLIPITIDGKRLTLPTHALLRAGEWDDLVAFHPVCEKTVRGESEVLKKIKTTMLIRITTIVIELMKTFAEIGVDTGRHKSLSPKASEVLSSMPGIDEKFVKILNRVCDKIDPSGVAKLISIYLKRGGMLRGARVARLANVDFPLLREIQDNDSEVFGVRLERRKDKLILEGLLTYILPDALDQAGYSAGSNSMVAPYFDALMRAYYKICYRLNDVVKIHKKHLQDADSMMTDLSWYDDFENLEAFNGQIPNLEGNEGELAINEDAPQQMTTATNAPQYVTPARAAEYAGAVVHAASPKQDTVTQQEKEDIFNTNNVSSKPISPFEKAASSTQSSDRNKQSGKPDAYQEWLNKHMAPAPMPQAAAVPYGQYVQPNPYAPQPAMPPGYPPQGYPQQPQPYGIAPGNLPTWAASAMPAPPPRPGEYAGRVRGAPARGPQYGYPQQQYPQQGYPQQGYQQGYPPQNFGNTL